MQPTFAHNTPVPNSILEDEYLMVNIFIQITFNLPSIITEDNKTILYFSPCFNVCNISGP